MKNLLDSADRAAIEARIASLGPDSRRRWGTLELPKAVSHMADQLSLALGEIEMKPIKHPARLFPLKQMVVWVMPWPRGLPTAPVLMSTDIAALDAAREHLLGKIDAFAERAGKRPFGAHPIFGTLDDRGWGRLAWRHLDHHLRQFGA